MKPIDLRRAATTQKSGFKKDIILLIVFAVFVGLAMQTSLFFPSYNPAGRVLVTSTYQPPGSDLNNSQSEEPGQATNPESAPLFGIVADPIQSIQPNIALFIIFSVIANIFILSLLLLLVKQISDRIIIRGKMNQPISTLARPKTKSIQEEVSR